METENIEQFLKNLGQECYVDKFRENHVDYRLLRELTEDDLKETLKELDLPVGVRMKILQKLKANKEGKWLFKKKHSMHFSNRITCYNVFKNIATINFYSIA